MKSHRSLLRRLNVAPGAPKYSGLSWVMLWAGLSSVVVAAWLMNERASALVVAESERATLQRMRLAQEATQRQAAAQATSPAAIARTKARQDLEHAAQSPWFVLFDALEYAAREARGTVSLVSLVPSIGTGAIREARITAIAASPQAMLLYVETLRRDSRLVLAELSGHQADPPAGADAVRAQVTIRWDPAGPWVPLGQPVKPGRPS